MSRVTFVVPIVLWMTLMINPSLPAAPRREQLIPTPPAQSGVQAETQLTGPLSVRGNEPFSYLSIADTATGVVYKLMGPLAEQLQREAQGLVVTVAGVLEREAVGPGMPAQLRVTEIVAVATPPAQSITIPTQPR